MTLPLSHLSIEMFQSVFSAQTLVPVCQCEGKFINCMWIQFHDLYYLNWWLFLRSTLFCVKIWRNISFLMCLMSDTVFQSISACHVPLSLLSDSHPRNWGQRQGWSCQWWRKQLERRWKRKKKFFFFCIWEWPTSFSAAVFLTEQSDSEDSSSSWLSSEGVTLWTWIIISLITIIILTALICLFYKTFRSCKKKNSEERIQWCSFDDLKMSRKQLK